MRLFVSKEAAQWYIKEMGLKENDSIKFYGKVYGPHDGFSIALTKMEPSRPFELITVEGINFYIEKSDAWFFTDKDLKVVWNEEKKEPEYEYTVTPPSKA